MRRHNRTIERECKGRNLFIPELLGGMGLVPPDGWKFSVNEVQAAVAAAMYDKDQYLYRGIGPGGPELKEAPQPLAAPWLCGLTFEHDELLGGVVVSKTMKEQRLTLSGAAKRYLRSGGVKYGRHLMLPLHRCTRTRRMTRWINSEERSWTHTDDDWSLVQRARCIPALPKCRPSGEINSPFSKLATDLEHLFDLEAFECGTHEWFLAPVH